MFGKSKRKKQEAELELVEKQIESPPVEIEPIEKPKPKATARIISMELLSSGLIETLFVSNSKMGELGEEFDI